VIDGHAHLVTDDIENYPTNPPIGKVEAVDLASTMTVERLLDEMTANGVDQAVLVQRGSIYGFDSSYVCDSAQRYPDRLTAVCSIDATKDDCAARVRYWAQKRGASGIRLMELVKGMDISWLDSPLAREAWEAAAELDLPVCVHLFPWNRVEGLNRILRILREVNGVKLVVDHLAAIESDAGPPDYGVDELLRQLAVFENVNIKLTTIPLGRLDKAQIDFRPVVRRVRDLFGAARMLWGSDITQSPGTYGYMAGLGRRAVEEGFTASERDLILGATAKRIYGKNWA
jgi:L-fuconolactonase